MGPVLTTALVLAGLGVLLVYPLLLISGHGMSLRMKRLLRRRLARSTRGVLRVFRTRIDRFKLTKKAAVRAALLADPVVSRAVADSARKDEDPDVAVDLDGAWERAEYYLEEIVPSFNILSYFKVGYATAHVALGGLYHLDLDADDAERLKPWLQDHSKSLLFLINHKSNADFVLLAWALAQRVALSYAVGEWARVWPLEPLFKSFGSYFVRRGERDPLYHAVLARYVQHVAINGVTQGVFLEGGLSRDGALRPAKVGLLDSIVAAKADAAFGKELWVVPAAISYDRVLEDETLIQEAGGRKPEHWERRRLLWKQARHVTRYLFGDGWRWPFARQRKFGRAAVRLGEPISVDAWLGQHPGWCTMERNTRKPMIQAFADDVMQAVGKTMAVLPMGILCHILHTRQALPEEEAKKAFHAAVATLKAQGARLWQTHHAAEDPFRHALLMLTRRGLIKRLEGAVVVSQQGKALVEYYARGLAMWQDVLSAGQGNAPRPADRVKA